MNTVLPVEVQRTLCDGFEFYVDLLRRREDEILKQYSQAARRCRTNYTEIRELERQFLWVSQRASAALDGWGMLVEQQCEQYRLQQKNPE